MSLYYVAIFCIFRLAFCVLRLISCMLCFFFIIHCHGHFPTFHFWLFSFFHIIRAREYGQKQKQIRYNKEKLVEEYQKEIQTLLARSLHESELEKSTLEISRLGKALETLNALITKEASHVETLSHRVQNEKLNVRSILTSFSTSQPILDRILHYEDRMKSKSPEWHLRVLKKQAQLVDKLLHLYGVRLESFDRQATLGVTSMPGHSPTAASFSPSPSPSSSFLPKRFSLAADAAASSSSPTSSSFDLRSYIQLANLRFPKNGDYYRLPMEHLNAGMYLLVRLVHIFSLVLDKRLPFFCDTSHYKPRMGSYHRIELSSSVNVPSPLVSLTSLSKSDILESMQVLATLTHSLTHSFSHMTTPTLIRSMPEEPSSNGQIYYYDLVYMETADSPREWLIALSMLHYNAAILCCSIGISFSSLSQTHACLYNLIHLKMTLASLCESKTSPSPAEFPWTFTELLHHVHSFYQICTKDTKELLLIQEELALDTTNEDFARPGDHAKGLSSRKQSTADWNVIYRHQEGSQQYSSPSGISPSSVSPKSPYPMHRKP